MTTKKRFPIVLNIDFFPRTEEGGEYKAPYNMFATTDSPVDLQTYGCDVSPEGDLVGSDEVYTSESGKQIRVVTRPTKAKVQHAISDAKAEALKKLQGTASTNFKAQVASEVEAPAGDVPF